MNDDALRYLALGDSYTIGERVPEAGRWPVQLVKLLRTEGVNIADPEIIARTGWTTDELAVGIERVTPQGPYDLVSLLIGVNNQYRGRSTDEYRHGFANLLDQAIAFAGGEADRVFVVSIPDWGVTPFAEGRDRAQIADEIDVFNTINRAEAKQRGVAYVDITPGSRKATSKPEFVAGDGLHPSASMYATWAQKALPVALEALKASE
ncbi:MAG TPA: SGNH/GDSL hydrolase family protein [Rhodothermales bacterium]|nr:SGNH/GDSL hydrolase family protein [Rhodothermales bacterium]